MEKEPRGLPSVNEKDKKSDGAISAQEFLDDLFGPGASQEEITPLERPGYQELQSEIQERKRVLLADMVRHQIKNRDFRQHGMSRIIGSDPAKVKATDLHYQNKFLDQAPEVFEEEKTPEWTRVLETIIKKMPEFIRAYGGQPVGEIKPEHFHLANMDKEGAQTSDFSVLSAPHSGGVFKPFLQRVGLKQNLPLESLKGNLLLQADIAAHELIHFHAFQSVETNQKESGEIRRIGLGINSKKRGKLFLNSLNEAITEELTRRFDDFCFCDIPELQSGLEERNHYIAEKYQSSQWPEKIDEILLIFKKEDSQGRETKKELPRRYKDVRRTLQMVINAVYERFPGKFSTKEDVFRVFAKAALSGKLLELARLLEATYGKGGFRRVAEGT